MWNCLPNCKICLREFVNNGPERSVEYRRNILHTGSTHLFDELIDWSSINVNEALPFCPFCLQSIERTSSLNENCNLIRKEVEDLVDKFTMESLRSRKVVKSRGGLLYTVPVKIEPHLNEKSNCVICYTVYSLENTAQTMLSIKHKINIGKTCTKYLLPGILKNECEFDWSVFASLPFEPFCTKCSIRVNRVVQLGQNLDQAKEEMTKFVDEFSLDCFKRQNTKNDEGTSEDFEYGRSEIESDVISVDERSENETISLDVQEFPQMLDDEDISSYDPMELDNTNPNTNGIQNGYFTDRRLPPITVNAGFLPSPRMTKTNFTHQNVQTADSKAARSRLTENIECTSSSDFQGSGSPMNILSFSTESVDDQELLQPPSNDSSTGVYQIGDQPGHKCSSCNRVFNFKCRLISHQTVNKTCSKFLKNLSRNSVNSHSQMPVLKPFDKVKKRNGYTCANCRKVFPFSCYLKRHENNSLSCAHFFANKSQSQIPTSSKRAINVNAQKVGSVKVDNDTTRKSKRPPKPKYKPWESKYLDDYFPDESNRDKFRQKKLTNISAITGQSKRVFQFKCTFCPARAKQALELSAHYQIHYDEAVETRCEICKCVYANRHLLERHRRNKHND